MVPSVPTVAGPTDMTGEAFTAGQEGKGEKEAEQGDEKGDGGSSGWPAFNSSRRICPVDDEDMDQPQRDDDRVYERVASRISMDLQDSMNNMHKMTEKLMMTNTKMVLDRLAENVSVQSKKIDTMTEAFAVKVQEFETKNDERFKKMEGDAEKKLQEQKASMNKVEEKMANLDKVAKEMHEANKRAPSPSAENIDPFKNFPRPASSPRPTSSASSTTGEWTPSSLNVKGWCRFGEAKGINANEARALGAQAVALLPGATRQFITSAEAPFIINRQVTLKVKAQVQQDQKQQCWSLLHNIRQKLTDNPIIIKGGLVYCIVEQSPAMRSRDKITGKASASLVKLVTSVCAMHSPNTHLDNIKVNWRAATIYYATSDDVATEKDQSTLLSTAGAPYFVENLSFWKHTLVFVFWSFIYMLLRWCCVRCGRSRACNVVGAVCCKRANNMPYVRCKQNI